MELKQIQGIHRSERAFPNDRGDFMIAILTMRSIRHQALKTAGRVLAAALALLVGGEAAATRVEEVAAGLRHPWAVAFIEEGRMLVTERSGQIRVIEPDGRASAPLDGLDGLSGLGLVRGQRGLLDLLVDQKYASNRLVYFCFSEADSRSMSSTSLARARMSDDRRALEDVKVIFSQHQKVYADHHFGCRIVQSPEGYLFLTLGDRQHRQENVQSLDNHDGKVVRVTTDGRAPAGNPFAGRPGALPEIWSYGHRNIQAAALSHTGALWVAEHGPLGGDELNLVMPGKNYGWPTITYGKNYDGKPIGEGITHAEGMEQAVKHWSTIAPSGMTFVTSDRYGARWKGSMLIGSLKGSLLRLHMDGDKVGQEHSVWNGRGERVRDVREAPDGTIYFLTDHPTNGRLLRLRP